MEISHVGEDQVVYWCIFIGVMVGGDLECGCHSPIPFQPKSTPSSWSYQKIKYG